MTPYGQVGRNRGRDPPASVGLRGRLSKALTQGAKIKLLGDVTPERVEKPRSQPLGVESNRRRDGRKSEDLVTALRRLQLKGMDALALLAGSRPEVNSNGQPDHGGDAWRRLAREAQVALSRVPVLSLRLDFRQRLETVEAFEPKRDILQGNGYAKRRRSRVT